MGLPWAGRSMADAADAELRRCILGGVSLLVGVVTLLVSLCVYAPGPASATSTPGFRAGAMGASVVGLLLLLSTLAVRSRGYQRFVFLWVGAAMTALLVVAAHAVSSRAVAVITLVAAALMTALASYAGATVVEDASAMGLPLFLGLLVLLGAGLLNGLVFRAHWLETACSLVAVCLFSALSVYDANRFVARRRCAYDCCEEGVFSLYQNFANVAASLMQLNSAD